jgi:hypothetical protein
MVLRLAPRVGLPDFAEVVRAALLRCLIARPHQAPFGRGWALSDGKSQLVEGGSKAGSCRLLDGDLVVAAA